VDHDAALLDATACTADPNNIFDLEQCSAQFENNNLGIDKARCVANDNTGQTGDSLICNVTFRNTGCNTPDTVATLSPVGVTLADPTGRPMPFLAAPGQITLNCPPACALGDVNGDQKIDSVDALFVQQYVAGLRQGSNDCPPPAGALSLPKADVNKSGGPPDAIDALFILQCVVGMRDCVTFQLLAAQSSRHEAGVPALIAGRQNYPAHRRTDWEFWTPRTFGRA
jgi:hypothetical protein